MKNLYFIMGLLVASMLIIGACSSKDPVDKISSYLEEMASLADPSDCDGSVDKLKSYMEDNKKDVEAAVMKLAENKDRDEVIKKKLDPIMDKAMPKFMEFGMKCQDKAKELESAFAMLKRL
jgi:outer membrane murein-binding lipoprotein Lpp